MTRVAYLGGAWATNIGNSFYNLGLLHLLKQVFGEKNVYHVPNLAGWFWDTPNAYDIVADVDADLFVMSGPCFSKELEMYRPIFRRIEASGAKLAFVSVGAGKYSAEEQKQVSALLNEFSDCLAFVTTRDSNTYELFKDLPCPVLDGVCGSMFVDDAVNVPNLTRSPYIVLNIDRQFEPTLHWDGTEIQIEPVEPVVPARTLAHRAIRKVQRARAPERDWPTTVGPFDIVRTQSGTFSRDPNAVFDRPTTHYAVIPDGYFAIYKSAELVITNRVHTVASTLILGGRARYLNTHARTSDGRWALLDRVGAGDMRSRPISLDRGPVDEGKKELKAFLEGQRDR